MFQKREVSPREKRTIYVSCVIIVVMSILFCLTSIPSNSSEGSTPVNESGLEQEPQVEVQSPTIGTASFDEIYRAYEENELVADDLYKYNRYRVSATINSMTNDGLFNLTGGATLTLVTKVDNTFVFLYAEFEKEQEEGLKTVKVGDAITFEGTCLSAGSWADCELIIE